MQEKPFIHAAYGHVIIAGHKHERSTDDGDFDALLGAGRFIEVEAGKFGVVGEHFVQFGGFDERIPGRQLISPAAALFAAVIIEDFGAQQPGLG